MHDADSRIRWMPAFAGMTRAVWPRRTANTELGTTASSRLNLVVGGLQDGLAILPTASELAERSTFGGAGDLTAGLPIHPTGNPQVQFG
ncbi:MAG: hypothetical protein WD066_13980 [Planctomycetaceae bacterium]